MGTDEYKKAKSAASSLLSELMTGVIPPDRDDPESATEQEGDEPIIDLGQIAKDAVSELVSGTLEDFMRVVGSLAEALRGDSRAWSTFLTHLWIEAAKQGYTVRTYVGRPEAVAVSRLGSLYSVSFEFGKLSSQGRSGSFEGDSNKTVPGIQIMQTVHSATRGLVSDFSAQSAHVDWRLRQDLRYFLTDDIGGMLESCQGKMGRRFGDGGFDKHRLATAFEYAAQNGLSSLDGRLVKGANFLQALVSDINRFTNTNRIGCVMTARSLASKPTAIMTEIDFGEHSYKFKLHVPSMALFAAQEALKNSPDGETALNEDADSAGSANEHNVSGASSLSPAVRTGSSVPTAPNIPSVRKSKGLAADALSRKPFVLQDMLLSSNVHTQREPEFKRDVVVGDKTFAEIQSMLNQAQGREQARLLIADALEISPDSSMQQFLTAARSRAKEDSRYLSLVALVQALM